MSNPDGAIAPTLMNDPGKAPRLEVDVRLGDVLYADHEDIDEAVREIIAHHPEWSGRLLDVEAIEAEIHRWWFDEGVWDFRFGEYLEIPTLVEFIHTVLSEQQ